MVRGRPKKTPETPELKGMIEDIVNKYFSFISVSALKDFVFGLIKTNYEKGLMEGEINYDRNFIPNYEAVSFIQNFAFNNVKDLAEETKNKLRQEVSMGLMNREGIAQLKLRVMDVMDVSISRAEMIARTETIRAFNMGHYQAAKDSGIAFDKQWSAAEDERTCPTCGYLDNQKIEMEAHFKNLKGEEFFTSPAHPNCRCRVIFVEKS